MYSWYRRDDKHNKNVLFDFYDFDITKQELLASITILAIFLVIGFIISGKITNSINDKNEIYNKAIKISSEEQFQYALDTNIGNSFVYGDLDAVDTVTYNEIGGEYMYIEKVTEEYTMHTRQVEHTTTDSKGKTTTYYTTETYYTWDEVDTETKHSKELKFLGIVFDYDKIDGLPSSNYIDTIQKNVFSDIRYIYYGTSTHFVGTIFTDIDNHTINNTTFYNSTIEETIEYLQSSFSLVLFWILWTVLIIAALFGFFYIDNRWLE